MLSTPFMVHAHWQRPMPGRLEWKSPFATLPLISHPLSTSQFISRFRSMWMNPWFEISIFSNYLIKTKTIRIVCKSLFHCWSLKIVVQWNVLIEIASETKCGNTESITWYICEIYRTLLYILKIIFSKKCNLIYVIWHNPNI